MLPLLSSLVNSPCASQLIRMLSIAPLFARGSSIILASKQRLIPNSFALIISYACCARFRLALLGPRLYFDFFTLAQTLPWGFAES